METKKNYRKPEFEEIKISMTSKVLADSECEPGVNE